MPKDACACTGMDRGGVTALMHSVLKLDMCPFPNGTCLDLMLHPSAVRGVAGLDALVAVIRAFVAGGGSGLPSTIFDVETIKDAQRHPERYDHGCVSLRFQTRRRRQPPPPHRP